MRKINYNRFRKEGSESVAWLYGIALFASSYLGLFVLLALVDGLIGGYLRWDILVTAIILTATAVSSYLELSYTYRDNFFAGRMMISIHNL